MKLFGSSADAHPLVAAFYKKKGIQLVQQTAVSRQGTAAVKTKGNGGNGKGNGKRGSAGSAGSGPERRRNKKRRFPQLRPITVVFNTADFKAEEFKNAV